MYRVVRETWWGKKRFGPREPGMLYWVVSRLHVKLYRVVCQLYMKKRKLHSGCAPKRGNCMEKRGFSVPRAGPQTWGTILDVKNGPPHPPRTTRGRAFRFALPLDPIPQRPREGDCGPPLLGTLPGLFSFRLSAFGPYFVTALGSGGNRDVIRLCRMTVPAAA